MKTAAHVLITPEKVVVGEKILIFGSTGADLLVEIYRQKVGNYPKFFKMDPLARLGFVATELLLGEENPRRTDCEDRAVVLFNRSASLADDTEYQKTIGKDGFFPSPAVFVYTLPNIVTGEVAIRNKYYGETSFYVLERRDDELMKETVEQSFQDPVTLSAIAGWLECSDPEHFEAELYLIEKQ